MAVDMLIETVNKAALYYKEQNKGNRPFRQPYVPPRDAFLQYQSLTSEKRQLFSQLFGDLWTQYEAKMTKLQNKYLGEI